MSRSTASRYCADLGQIGCNPTAIPRIRMGDRKAGGLAVERLHRIAVLAFPQRHLPHRRFELALDRLDLVLDPLALRLRQFVERFRRQHLAIARRRQSQARRRPQQGDVLRRGALLQRAERLFAALSELLLDRLATGAILIALEGGRQRRAQFGDQPLHRRR